MPRVFLRPVTLANRGDLEDLSPGEREKHWVHSNWYWHQQSLDNPNITFRLIHLEGVEAAVGMVAYGPFYQDAGLTKPVAGAYELIHLVVDRRWQGRGIGKIVARAVIGQLRSLPDCECVRVAHNPENLASRAFFTALGFAPSPVRNYDGDPVLALESGVAHA